MNSADQLNYYARGAIITLDVTDATGTPSIVLAVELKTANGDYVVLLKASAITAIGRHTYIVYPGAGAIISGAYQEEGVEGGDIVYPSAAVNDVDLVVGLPLGLNWRVTVTHADTDSITYSVAAAMVR